MSPFLHHVSEVGTPKISPFLSPHPPPQNLRFVKGVQNCEWNPAMQISEANKYYEIQDPYCSWFRNPANQLRLVVYPFIYDGF